MDDRQFDNLSRRIGALALPRLPRRGLLGLLGGAALTGSLGLLVEVEDAAAKKKKCKKEGKGCNKKKCKKKNKKCCCKNLKCKNDVCEGEGSQCPVDVEFDDEWIDFDSADGPDTFDFPWGITTDPNGNVYVTDQDNERVLTFEPDGSLTNEFGTEGNDDDEFQEPAGIGFNRDDDGNNRILVLDPGQSNTDRMFRKFRTDGDTIGSGNLGQDNLTNPNGIAVDQDDRIWIVDTDDGQVWRFNTFGENPTVFTPGGNGDLDGPLGIAVFEDDDDNATYVFVADSINDRIVKFEFVNNNTLAFRVDSGDVEFNDPTGIAVDECGNVWVADRLNNRIQILDKDLDFIDRFSSGFSRPTGVAFSPNGKTLYVTDSENDRVVLFTLS